MSPSAVLDRYTGSLDGHAGSLDVLSDCSSDLVDEPFHILDQPRKKRKLSNDSAEHEAPATHADARAENKTSESRITPRQPKSASHSQSKWKDDRNSADDHVTTSTTPLTKNTFTALNLAPWLVHSLSLMSITRPTPVQSTCIPPILLGRDCIGGSETGSGKTLAFALPIIQRWAADPTGIFAVVLTPTRELALQLYEQFCAVAAPQSLKPILVTGGADMRTQALELARRPHVVIATPGRLADHVRSSGEDTIVGLKRVRFLVLDEADRLLAGGNGSMLPAVSEVLGALPPSTERQTLLFTATMTDEVRALKDLPRPPSRPSVFVCDIASGQPTVPTSTSTSTPSPAIATPATLKQSYLRLPTQHKASYLHVLLTTPLNTSKRALVFVNRTTTATHLTTLLQLLHHRATSLHSALPQRDRTSNLARFRAGPATARILVATDVAARGLDIPDVELVVNFDVPRDPDDYVHRVGRTARAGRVGESVTMVGQRDVERVLAVEARTGVVMGEWGEEGVSVEGRVVRGALKEVGEMGREAALLVEQGRDVKGRKGVQKQPRTQKQTRTRKRP